MFLVSNKHADFLVERPAMHRHMSIYVLNCPAMHRHVQLCAGAFGCSRGTLTVKRRRSDSQSQQDIVLLRVSGFGIRGSGLEVRVSGIGNRDSRFGNWDSGFGTRVSRGRYLSARPAATTCPSAEKHSDVTHRVSPVTTLSRVPVTGSNDLT